MFNSLKNTLRGLQRATGIDFHVAATLLLRGWGLAAGGVMILIISATLTPQQQGFYFTFSSLLGLQIFFELGLNQVVIQLVSHESAHISRDALGCPNGDFAHLDRLASIVRLLRRWYLAAAIAFCAVTTAVGILLFHRAENIAMSNWLGPWVLLVIVTALNLYLSPMLAVIEGCGWVGQVARLRLVQSFAGYITAWIALYAGAGLWSIACIAGASSLLTAAWLLKYQHPLRPLEAVPPVAPERAVDWRREVLPFQWRIAVSWISGYLIFQLSVPMVFSSLGSVIAGRLGMTLAIFNGIFSIGIGWINAKLPELTAHISRKERSQLDVKFSSVLVRALLLTFMLSAALLFGGYLFSSFEFQFMKRVTDFPTMACIALQNVLTILVYGWASYMRAHREEPMLPVSVVGGLVTLAALSLASRQGSFATVLAQLLVTLFITIPWTWLLYRRYRRFDI